MRLTLEEEKKRKDDENRVLPGCRFATLAMLSGNVDILVGQSSVQKQQVGALKRVKPAPSGVIIVLIANTSIGAAILFFAPSLHRDSLTFIPNIYILLLEYNA